MRILITLFLLISLTGDVIPKRKLKASIIGGEEMAYGQSPPAEEWGFPTDDLIGYWTFDVDDGTYTADSSGNGYNGNVTGATWTSTTTNRGTGYMTFDGSDDKIVVPSGSLLENCTNVTMMAWVRFLGEGVGNHTIMVTDKDGSTLRYGIFRVENSSLGRTGLFIGSWADYNTDDIINNDYWYHIASTFDGSNIKFYINGALVHTTPLAGAIATGAGDLWMGADKYGEWTHMDMNHLAVFDVAVSGTIILDIYDNQKE